MIPVDAWRTSIKKGNDKLFTGEDRGGHQWVDIERDPGRSRVDSWPWGNLNVNWTNARTRLSERGGGGVCIQKKN